MSKKGVRPRRRATAIAAPLALASAGAVLSIMSASPAQALCSGVGSWDDFVILAGAETVQWASTCDGSGFYSGKVLDSVTDGYCVEADYREYYGGAWHYYNAQGLACTTGGWSNYTWQDQNGTTDAQMRLQVGSGTTSWVSTWGY